MRGNVDIQKTSTVGAFVWSSGADCGRDVCVQQFAKISGRTGNATRSVSVGCDGYGAERSGVKREPDSERASITEMLA